MFAKFNFDEVDFAAEYEVDGGEVELIAVCVDGTDDNLLYMLRNNVQTYAQAMCERDVRDAEAAAADALNEHVREIGIVAYLKEAGR